MPFQTNMVFVKVAKENVAALQAHLAGAGVTAIVSPRTRLVTHLDVDRAGIDRAVAAFASWREPIAVRASA
jgi:threonine aldolase